MTANRKWKKLFGFPRRKQQDPLEEQHCNLALAIQKVTEEVVIKMAKEAKRLTKADYCCLAGGVALNCVANGKLWQSGLFKDIFIQPAAGDAGGALGAALAVHHIYFNSSRKPTSDIDEMQGAYLGPSYSTAEIKKALRPFKAVYTAYKEEQKLINQTADLIKAGFVIGWFQGRMEFGPRALGNRSILGDSRNPTMQQTINQKIKFRESFRPFAPAVLESDVSSYFEFEGRSPYMSIVCPIKKNHLTTLPKDYARFSMEDKRATVRSILPAITHIDHSARLQTVSDKTNPRFTKLLQAFKEKTGCGVFINTSFNVRGEPIVCSPEDAFRCFINTDMDYLVIGNLILEKSKQSYKNRT